MLTPTELPSLAGLTTYGSGQSASAAASLPVAPGSCGSRRQRGVGSPLLSKIRLDITLSNPSALARIPDPVHGICRHAHSPWTAPSSPYVPCSAFHTTWARDASSRRARLVAG